MAERYPVSVGAGSLCIDDGVAVPHAWTGAGVTVEATFSGAHLLHLAVAGCVLNDVYREADKLGLRIDGVRVTAQGGFEEGTWRSTGIEYLVAVDSTLGADEVERLLAVVDDVAEIPRTLAAGTAVRRAGAGDPA
jgi:uncharacterized OsmC-like protein